MYIFVYMCIHTIVYIYICSFLKCVCIIFMFIYTYICDCFGPGSSVMAPRLNRSAH